MINAKIEIKAINTKNPKCRQPVLGNTASVPNKMGVPNDIRLNACPAGSVSRGDCR